jgi:hypothetical protein
MLQRREEEMQTRMAEVARNKQQEEANVAAVMNEKEAAAAKEREAARAGRESFAKSSISPNKQQEKPTPKTRTPVRPTTSESKVRSLQQQAMYDQRMAGQQERQHAVRRAEEEEMRGREREEAKVSSPIY